MNKEYQFESLSRSTNPDKKWTVVLQTATGRKKTIHFGAKGMNDYTLTGDKEAREKYLNRHRVRENWEDPSTAGFWSRWLLWGDSTDIHKNLRQVIKKFHL